MGLCCHGLLGVVVSDLPQMEEVAETAEEEKANLTILKISNFDLSFSDFPLSCLRLFGHISL